MLKRNDTCGVSSMTKSTHYYGLPALSIDGPKGVGKSSTALERAATVFELDAPGMLDVVRADPARLVTAAQPVVIDEWQRFRAVRDVVRRSVDRDGTAGQFILTGSASPASPQTHSEAARIVPIRMRPMTLPERGIEQPTDSLAGLLRGSRTGIDGSTTVGLEQYFEEILASGLPGIRRASGCARRELLRGYVQLAIDRDFPDAGRQVRNPAALRRWIAAYAAALARVGVHSRCRSVHPRLARGSVRECCSGTQRGPAHRLVHRSIRRWQLQRDGCRLDRGGH